VPRRGCSKRVRRVLVLEFLTVDFHPWGRRPDNGAEDPKTHHDGSVVAVHTPVNRLRIKDASQILPPDEKVVDLVRLSAARMTPGVVGVGMVSTRRLLEKGRGRAKPVST
jgi:hypothetical protein